MKTAIVTGASRGIGRAIALSLAHNGYSLALCCHTSESALYSVAEECRTLGVSCYASLCDVRSSEQVAQFIERARKELGSLSLLVNNAGISYIGLLTDMSDSDWHSVIQTNLDSVFYMSRAVLPSMLHEHKGHIINISSVWGSHGASMEVAYSASKGGMEAFTKALAREVAPSGIAVNAIACGLIDTDMNACLSPDELASLLDEIPSGKIILPEDIASLVVSIATQPIHLTGQIITMDGSWC